MRVKLFVEASMLDLDRARNALAEEYRCGVPDVEIVALRHLQVRSEYIQEAFLVEERNGERCLMVSTAEGHLVVLSIGFVSVQLRQAEFMAECMRELLAMLGTEVACRCARPGAELKR